MKYNQCPKYGENKIKKLLTSVFKRKKGYKMCQVDLTGLDEHEEEC